jgi:ribonuclease HI
MDQPDIEIASTPELAIQADRIVRSGPTLYTDASVRNGVCGIGVVRAFPRNLCMSGPTVTPPISITIGQEETCSTLSAELKAIQVAIETTCAPCTWIASDSQRALRAIEKGEKFTGTPEACRGVRAALARAQEEGRAIHFRWVPAHAGVRGNEEADRAAKAATKEGAQVTDEPTRQVTENKLVWKSIQKDLEATERTKPPGLWGKYTLRLDKAIPGKHTIALYDALSASQARTLVQARTNHTHLLEFKAKIRAVASGECECSRGKETVRHVLLECERWAGYRTELRTAAGKRWGDLSYMLGGYTERKD